MSQTRTQRYAGSAMAQVDIAAKKPPEYRKKYKTRAESFPAMLMQSGLTQSLGFLLGKAQGSDGEAYADYAETLAVVVGVAGAAGEKRARILHRQAIESDLGAYRRLTREVLQAAILVRRFAQIELKEAKPGKSSTDDLPADGKTEG